MQKQRFQFFNQLIIIIISCISLNSNASINNLDEKFQMEKAISEKLEQVLKTRLDKSYFDITVIAQVKTSNTKLQQTINSGTVYKSNGEVDLVQTWLLKEIGQKKKPIEFESFKITLGLSDKVRADYREDLGKWLNNWTAVALGPSASTEILVRPTNVLNEPSSEELPSKIFTVMGTFQNLIGMLFLGIVFLFAFVRSRPQEKKALAPTKDFISVDAGEKTKQLSKPDSEFETLDFLKTLKTRVAVAGKTMSSQVEHLLNRWATKEHENLLKVVALLEVLAENGSALENLHAEALPVLSNNASTSLSKAFTELQNLSVPSRIELLEEIYAELVTGNLIRLSSSQPPFEFIEIFEPPKLKEIFSLLPSPHQVSLFAKMSESARLKFFNSVGPDFINKIFEASLQTHHVSDEELLEELKKSGANTKKEILWKSDFTEQSLKKVRQVWASLSRKDETLWLYRFVSKNPEMKKYFDNEKYHLAFLTFWPPQELRKFYMQVVTNELAAAIKFLPHLNEPILNTCGVQMRTEISDCMATLEEPKLSQYFEGFTAAYDAYIKFEHATENKDVDFVAKKSA